jgi:anti-sigma factor RsiW
MNTPGNTPMAPWLEEAWLNRYLDRQLDEAELEWFEAYMLDKPRLLEQVDADTRLGASLAVARSAPPTSALPASQLRAAAIRPPRRPAMVAGFGLLAGVLVGIAIPAFQGRNDSIVASPQRVVFDTMRGEATAAISQGDSQSPLLIVDIATPSNQQIKRASAIVAGRSIQLPTPVVAADGFVTFVVPARWQGVARIELEFVSGAGESKRSYQL